MESHVSGRMVLRDVLSQGLALLGGEHVENIRGKPGHALRSLVSNTHVLGPGILERNAIDRGLHERRQHALVTIAHLSMQRRQIAACLAQDRIKLRLLRRCGIRDRIEMAGKLGKVIGEMGGSFSERHLL